MPPDARSSATSSLPDDASSLGAMLKSRTQSLHDQAEQHPFHAVLDGADGIPRAREAYVRSLAQHMHLQQSFEPLLQRAASRSYVFRALARPHHFRLSALHDDLEALGATATQLKAHRATTRFTSLIEACAANDGCALLGVWYVFEGSTNGGTIIAKRIRDLLSLPTDAGTRFVNPHGPLVRSRWREWKATLDALEFDVPHRLAIVDAARETFSASIAIMSDVHGFLTADRTVHVGKAQPFFWKERYGVSDSKLDCEKRGRPRHAGGSQRN